MAAIRILLGFICLVIFGKFTEPSSDFLRREGRKAEGWKGEGWKVEGTVFSDGRLAFGKERLGGRLLGFAVRKLGTENWKLQTSDRELILGIAQSQVGVREATGNNDGAAVEAFLTYTGNKKGEPWCASFISWVYGKAGFSTPKTAWSPSLFPIARLVSEPQAADVFGIHFPKLNRIAHCGIVERSKGNWIYSIEGNTNLAGSREGDGVYRKLRHKHTIKYYSNWINKQERRHFNEN